MDFSAINIFKLMKTSMGYMAERQDVFAQNVANIDTPGYQARDLKKLDFEKLAMIEASRLDIRATNPKHMLGGRNRLDADFRHEDQRYVYETNPVENSASVEDQMKLIAENNIRYQMTTNLYKKMTDLFKIAISNR